MQNEYPLFQETPFKFAMSMDAAKHNSTILQQHGFDIPAVFNAITAGTQLEYGSEFRPASKLEPILQNHSLWERTKRLLQHGSTIPLQQSDPEIDKLDVSLGLQRGNHKGATL